MLGSLRLRHQDGLFGLRGLSIYPCLGPEMELQGLIAHTGRPSDSSVAVARRMPESCGEAASMIPRGMHCVSLEFRNLHRRHSDSIQKHLHICTYVYKECVCVDIHCSDKGRCFCGTSPCKFS